MLQKTLMILGVVWSVLVGVALVSFYASDEWKQWRQVQICVFQGKCPSEFYSNSQFVKYSDEIVLKLGNNAYLYGNSDAPAEREARITDKRYATKWGILRKAED